MDLSSAPVTAAAPATSASPITSTAATPAVDQPPPSSSSSSATVAAATPNPAPLSAPLPNPNPENPQQPPQLSAENPQPSLGRARPHQPPFIHISPHPPAASSSMASSSSSSSSAPSTMPSTAPNVAVQRGMVALGVPATMRLTQQAGGSFSAYGPASFNQPFGGFSRAPATISEVVSNSGSQARPPVPGVQTIGIIGSMGPGSQLRPGGATSLQQQRSTQPPALSQAPPANSSLPSQKFQNHGMLRGPTIGPPGSISSATSHGSQIPQPPWVSGQAKQIQTNSVPSSSFRPQVRPQSMMNQRTQTPHLMHSVPTSSNQQLPPTPQQQQSHMRPQSTSEQYSQQYHTPRAPQGVSPQQQSIRAPVLANQKSVTVNGQPGILQVSHPTITSNEPADDGTHILSKRSIHELVTQIDPSEKLDPEVEDILVDIAEDFVESITTFACSLAKHRKSTTLESKDILLHLERNWNMTLPGFSGDEIKSYKKPLASDIHRERLTAIKKSATVSESGILKSTSAHVAANAKGHLGKGASLGLEKS